MFPQIINSAFCRVVRCFCFRRN